MPDPTTTNLILAVPTRGSDAGTWDTPVNGDMQIIDACAGNVTTKNVSGLGTITLSTSESQVSIIRLSGTVTQTLVITLGAIIKSWIVENNTVNNGFSMTFTGSTGTGNVIMPPPGSCQIYWDGTNVSFLNLGPRIGSYEDFSSASVPLWISSCTVPPFLNCNGVTFNATTYPLLNAILSGNTLPDLRGRARFCLDQGQGRITGAGSSIDGSTRFSAGGSQNIQIQQTNLPAVTFPSTQGISGSVTLSAAANGVINSAGVGGGANVTGGGGAYSIGVMTASLSASITGSVSSGGTGALMATMPPTIISGIMMIRAG